MIRNEAIERIKARFDKWALDDEDMKAIQTLIPELRESDDERIRKELKEAFEAYDIESKWNGIPIRSIFAWLEKQKEQKPEWSEEDEAMRDNILRLLSCFVGTSECDSNPSLSTSYPAYQREMDWLKSLRPSWKPSEVQMKALQNAVALTACDKELARLYNQLKKL